MLLTILLVFHIVICVALIITVLLQQSEGGALGMGGGPSGFMTARGAGNLLTRITWILFTLFLLLSIGLTLMAASQRNASSLTGGIERVDPNSLTRPLTPAPTPAPDAAPALPTAPLPQSGLPIAPAPATTAPATTPAAPQ
jgi:preprotein translocase subunit SecG